MKFLIGSEKVFIEFVDSIGEDDKIGILSHNDLDGIAAALLMEEILRVKKLNVILIDFIGYSFGMFDKYIIEMKEKGISKVFLTDMNADNSDLGGFERLRNNFDVLLVDHHPINPEMKDNKNIIKNHTPDCSTWVLYNFSGNFFPVEKWNWLVCATMISEWSFKDAENLAFLKSKFKDIDVTKPFESESGIVASKISNALKYYRSNIRKVYDLIKNNNFDQIEKASTEVETELNKTIKLYEESAEFYPEKNLYFYIGNPRFGIGNLVITILSQKKPSTFVFASDSIDGKVKISFRNNAGTADMNKLVRKAIIGLENSSGGGHSAAASATILSKDFDKFKENILN